MIAAQPMPDTVTVFIPTYFFEYDYIADTFTQVKAIIPSYGGDSLANSGVANCKFLDLPDGNVLVSIDGALTSRRYYIYSPGSGPIAAGKPTIDNITTTNCTDYMITGKLFNGISEGASFGDDAQMATNYPIVRLTDSTNVYYARTTSWNRIGAVMTDSLEDTAYFTLPSMPNGTYSLVVVANGNPSNPALLTLPCVITSTQTPPIINNRISVYPNPNKGLFTLELSSIINKSTIEVSNLLGQQVFKEELTGSKNKIDLSLQPSGLYIYRVLNETGEFLSSGKLVIQN